MAVPEHPTSQEDVQVDTVEEELAVYAGEATRSPNWPLQRKSLHPDSLPWRNQWQTVPQQGNTWSCQWQSTHLRMQVATGPP